MHGPAAGAKKAAPPGHYVGKIGKDDWNVRQLEERLREREKGRTDGDKKKSVVEKPQVDWCSREFDGELESEEEETVEAEKVNRVNSNGVISNLTPLRSRPGDRTTPLEQPLGHRNQDRVSE